MISGALICTITAAALPPRLHTHQRCEPTAQGGPIALLMSLAVAGYVLADVAADGLTASYARREPRSSRGRTQTGVYFCRTIGKICAGVLVGVGMNSHEYNGETYIPMRSIDPYGRDTKRPLGAHAPS